MSEETPSAKKATRKSTRKKSASKQSSSPSEKDESSPKEAEVSAVEKSSSGNGENPSKEQEVTAATSPSDGREPKNKEPKTKVRDARRETAGEPLPPETAEKLVPSEGDGEPKEDSKPKDRGRKKEKAEDQPNGRDRSDSGERRSRGRGRGGRDRNEKRDPKPKTTVDTKDLAKKAWKIFESEVTEEGLALLDDNGFRDFARGSFNAARLFLEEKERVVAREKQLKAEQKRRDRTDSEQKSKED